MECCSVLVKFFFVTSCFCLVTFANTAIGQVQPFAQHKQSFDVISGQLIYFDSDVRQQTPVATSTPYQNSYSSNPPLTAFQTTLSQKKKSQFAPVANDNYHDQRKHYHKGTSQLSLLKGSNTQREARRQGQQCPGICRYIPDRDFCPTTILEEYEADDDDYYLEENSIEESDEYYYDDDVEQTEGNRESREKKTAGNRRHDEYGLGDGQASSGTLHVVYPSLTKFAVGKGTIVNKNSSSTSTSSRRGANRNLKRKRDASRRRRRLRRLQQRPVKFRPSALEQEILIRWDRVVERGPLIGGDIAVPEGVLLRPANFGFQRNRWPKGVVPYMIDPSLNDCRLSTIFDAMDEIEDRTCIRFVEREKERNYIQIRRTQVGCASYVGMVGGAQQLNLSTGCFSKFTVTHELIHALGFDHEQSRKDRDKYIEIDFDNVLKEKDKQFELNRGFTGSGLPYDIRSIMHYSAFLFAKDKCEPTIYPVNEKIDICELGAGNGRGGMTNCDAAKINKFYNCGKRYPKKCKV